GGRLYALNPDGTQKWVNDQIGSAIGLAVSSPGIGPDGTIYIGSFTKNLYAINPTDGSQKWAFQTGGYLQSSPAIGADGVIYISSND
ncbi:PQQ-binding-like beta-propeller repeat protein, partial [Acinetobacter baumannii]